MGRRRALRESGPVFQRRDKGEREYKGPPGKLSDEEEEILSAEEAFDGSDDEVVYGGVLRTIGRRNKNKDEIEQGDMQLFHEDEESGDGNSSDEGDDSSACVDGGGDGSGGLIDFVDSLGSIKTRSARVQNDLQTLPETEFALPPSHDTLAAMSDGGGVSLEALVAPLQDKTAFAAIIGRVKDLSASSQEIKPPSEPIIARHAERAVTYENARTESTRWVPAVQKERQAEVSDFRPKIDHVVSKPSTGAFIDKFVPHPGTMESRVADLLSEVGNCDDDKEKSSHDLKTNVETVEEGLTRRYDDDPEEAKHKLARLKNYRALLFYHERKRHQINKIKSKLYHKIRRKQKKRRVEEEGGSHKFLFQDGGSDVNEDEEDEENQAIVRARERATLRHSAMKLLKGHKGLRGVRSREISESARLAKELQQKVQGGTSEDEDSGLSDNAEGSSDEDGCQDQKTLETIGTDQYSDTRHSALAAATKGGLMSMEFMKRGTLKQQEMIKLERDKALNELNSLKNEEEGDTKKAIHNPDLDALEPIVMHYSSKGLKGMKEGDDNNNPWLGAQKVERCDDEARKHRRKAAASRGYRDVIVNPIDAALGALPDHQPPNLEVNTRNGAAVSATCDENGLMKGGGHGVSNDRKNITNRKARAPVKIQNEEESAAAAGGSINQQHDEFSHEELVRHAFTAPNLEQAFRDMKAGEVERETEKELGKISKRNGGKSFTETAAGWGSWTGLGAPAPRKLQLSLARAEEVKQKALLRAKQKRKDASLPTVMINGKRQKRSALLRVAQVPYPFTSRKQYERSMRRPIGPEWNTCQSVRALTKKPELTRAGAIIAPISTKVKEG